MQSKEKSIRRTGKAHQAPNQRKSLIRETAINVALNGGNSVFYRFNPLQGLFYSTLNAENYEWQDKPDYGKEKSDHPEDDH